MHKVLVLGRGFLGREFERRGFEVWGRDKFDYVNGITGIGDYDVIVNCIAKSGTRWCEDVRNFEEAFRVNASLPMALSHWCRENGRKFVHISTGCLYDRTDIVNTEAEFVAAHCNYTLTKWAGELCLDRSRDLILRPRLLFDGSRQLKNFLFRLSGFSRFVADVEDSLTSTSTLVAAVDVLIRRDAVGVFNVAQEGSASIYQIAEWCGIEPRQAISAAELRKVENIHLVNNRMSIDKLKGYYTPAKLFDEVRKNHDKDES